MNAFRPFSALALLFLCGCTLLGGQGAVQQNYVLSAPAVEAQTPSPLNVKVLPVEVASGLDTTRIGLIENGVQINYLADSKWAAPLPQMLQFLWVDTLRQSHLVASASSDTTGSKADRLISITANAFNLVRRAEGDLQIKISYEAKILAPLSHQVLSVDTVALERTAPSSDLNVIMQSFSAANAEAMGDLLKKLALRFK